MKSEIERRRRHAIKALFNFSRPRLAHQRCRRSLALGKTEVRVRATGARRAALVREPLPTEGPAKSAASGDDGCRNVGATTCGRRPSSRAALQSSA
jgi:hypothetical protein